MGEGVVTAWMSLGPRAPLLLNFLNSSCLHMTLTVFCSSCFAGIGSSSNKALVGSDTFNIAMAEQKTAMQKQLQLLQKVQDDTRNLERLQRGEMLASTSGPIAFDCHGTK
jgi:hypothetical protein